MFRILISSSFQVSACLKSQMSPDAWAVTNDLDTLPENLFSVNHKLYRSTGFCAWMASEDPSRTILTSRVDGEVLFQITLNSDEAKKIASSAYHPATTSGYVLPSSHFFAWSKNYCQSHNSMFEASQQDTRTEVRWACVVSQGLSHKHMTAVHKRGAFLCCGVQYKSRKMKACRKGLYYQHVVVTIEISGVGVVIQILVECTVDSRLKLHLRLVYVRATSLGGI